MAGVPERPSLEGLETKWSRAWEDDDTYRFELPASRADVFAIDTPPPTVSGSLHVGSAFGYVQQDTLARYHRMRGEHVFYPMGWDDNGLPTERRVENHFGVRCDPSLSYEPGLAPPGSDGPKQPVSRPNFVELCLRLTAEDEAAFEDLWRRLGLSVDWSHVYTTIGTRSQRVSQRAFLRNLARGEAYQAEAPTLWDVTYQTAVAQAELEDREIGGAYHRLAFGGGDGAEPVLIDTTRPELLPACVALVVHPDDARHRPRVGTQVRTPLFDVAVPVVSHELADPDKGTGAAMICTFGDTTDVLWWRELGLPVRSVVGRDGRLSADPPAGVPTGPAWRELAGCTVPQARKRVVELLDGAGALVGEPRTITHPVKFFEKGDRPLEIVTSRQWFIRILDRRDDLLARGKELHWHPPPMGSRYESWVQGLNTDWLISRQRFFGVPVPLWYALDQSGRPDYERLLVPAEDRLPVDPSTDVPEGYEPAQRGRPGGFAGDPDVMDTWATSSLTPQIACGWEEDDRLFERTFPMDLRPQGPEIIRTWLFSSVVRAQLEHDRLPWSDAAINGWVLDPDRKKMSKSKGNVLTPAHLLEQHGSDAVRYWAARGRPGTDTAFDEGQIRIGRRLAIKVLNVSRFILGLGDDGATGSGAAPTHPLDRAVLARLAAVVGEAGAAFDAYDYARALERSEAFFWTFCDDVVELVKGRAYGAAGPDGARSARAGLQESLSALLRLLAPFLPFATEEAWSWWRDGSIHGAPWPDPAGLAGLAGGGDPAVLEATAATLGEVRKAKTAARRSLRSEVTRLVVTSGPERLAALEAGRGDLIEAGRVVTLDLVEGDPAAVEVTLAEG